MSSTETPNPDQPTDATTAPADVTSSPEVQAQGTPEPSSSSDASPTPEAVAEAPSGPSMSPVEATKLLKDRFPALFGFPPKPLKLRIQADIQERLPGVFSKSLLSAVLRRHTNTTSYLIALSRAKQRFDLDGQPSGELSDEHRKVADDELQRRRAITEERRAQEEQARRQRFGLLRDFETTTLTRQNFCALKGVAEDELDGLLAQIRTEKAEWEAQRPAHAERGDRRPGGPGARRDGDRPPRRDGQRPGGRPQGDAPRGPRRPRQER